jgi:hypothetical protein
MTNQPEIVTLLKSGLDLSLIADTPETTFMEKANCKGISNPDIFHSDEPRDIRAAKNVCATCPVRLECFKYGETEEYGIYGGLTPSERRSRRSPSHTQRVSLVDLMAQKSFIERASVRQVASRYNVEPRTVQRWRVILKNYDAKEQRETQR